MQDAAPAKPQRRPVRHGGDGLDRLGPLQEPDRTGGKMAKRLHRRRSLLGGRRGLLDATIAWWHGFCRAQSRRGRGGDGEFGRMRRRGRRAASPAARRAARRAGRRDRRDRPRGLRRLGVRRPRAIRLLVVPALDCERGEADDVEAIAGVEGVAVTGAARGLEAFAKQPGDDGPARAAAGWRRPRNAATAPSTRNRLTSSRRAPSP